MKMGFGVGVTVAVCNTVVTPVPSFSGGILDSIANVISSAYSLNRRLKTSYTGAAFRIKKVGVNSYTDINFKANGTVDKADVTAFAGGVQCVLVAVYNQNGTTNHLFNNTESLCPYITDTSGNCLTTTSGKIRCNFELSGSVKWLEATTSIVGNKVSTAFGVWKPANLTLTNSGYLGVGWCLGNSTFAGNNFYLANKYPGQGVCVYAGSNISPSSAVTDLCVQEVSTVMGSTTFSYTNKVNGNARTSSNTSAGDGSPVNFTTELVVGNTKSYAGFEGASQFCELIVLENSVATNTKDTMMTEFMTYYGIN